MFKRRQKTEIKKDTYKIVVAALGVLEDNLCSPVPFDDINFCLRIDFKNKMKDNQIIQILNESLKNGYVKNSSNGWNLTKTGEKLVDNFLKDIFYSE